jgi:ribbon-helix-helix CopG family protein
VTAAPRRNLPLKSSAMEPDLIAGLQRLFEREHLPINALVRRAIRRELEREGILAALEKGGRRIRESRKRTVHVR